MFAQTILGVLIAAAVSTLAAAAESAAYTYDAHGRLVKVVRTGTMNNNAQTTYQHDAADNRVRATVTGAP